jgi:hypothetical protein
VLDAWSVFDGSSPISAATDRGVGVGVTPDAARATYGAAVELGSESGIVPRWATGRPSATVTADGGRIDLAELLRPGQFDVLSAGSDCPLDPISPPSSTVVLPDVDPTVIDLSQAAPALVPTVLASYPRSTSADGVPQLVIGSTGSDEIAVLDSTTGVVDFLARESGQVLRSTPVSLAPGSTTCCFLYFGPDDIMYVNQLESGSPEFAAYALIDDAYVEIARRAFWTGDVPVALLADGIGYLGEDAPGVPFVGADGQPSGATLDIEPLRFDARGRMGRGDSVWDVTYPAATCEGCSAVQLGPGTSVVLTDAIPDGSGVYRLTVLDGPRVTQWDSADWFYVGPLDGALLLERRVGDRVEIGIVELASTA